MLGGCPSSALRAGADETAGIQAGAGGEDSGQLAASYRQQRIVDTGSSGDQQAPAVSRLAPLQAGHAGH